MILEPFRLIKSSYSNDHTVSSQVVFIVCFYFSQAISMALWWGSRQKYLQWINSSPSACIDLIQTPYNLQQNTGGNQATIYN